MNQALAPEERKRAIAFAAEFLEKESWLQQVDEGIAQNPDRRVPFDEFMNEEDRRRGIARP